MDTDSAQFPTQPRVVRAHQSVYGVREARLRSGLKTVSMTFEMTGLKRPAVELLFDLCTVCKQRRRHCTCHERGYN